MKVFPTLPLVVCALSFGAVGCNSSDDLSNAHADANDDDVLELDASPDVPATDSGIDARDTAVDTHPDTTPIDSGVDAPAEVGDTACTPNACGVCGALEGTGKPGDICGACGKVECSTDGSKLSCNDPGKNACGGCTVLSGTKGAGCGACGGGTLTCSGTDALTCTGSSAANPCGGCAALAGTPGTACGCSGSWTCSGATAVVCSGDTAKNACGGCGVLANAPDALCGVCGTGKYVCNAAGTATTCADPGTNVCLGCGMVTGGAPGDKCGTCGTITCNAAKTNTSCIDAPYNACRVCAPEPKYAPGTACGACGTFQCDTTGTATTCIDSGYKAGIDFAFDDFSTNLTAVNVAMAYNTLHAGRVTDVDVRVVKQLKAVSVVIPGGVKLDLYQGTPGSGGALLGTVSVDQSLVPTATASAGAFFNFHFATPATLVASGTPIYALFQASGNAYDYYYWSGRTASAGYVVSTKNATAPTYTTSLYRSAIQVRMSGCF